MSTVARSRVTIDLAISLDGFVVGPNQSLENPIGENGDRLHRWMFEAASENAAEVEAIVSSGAYIMGRNMLHLAPVLLGSGERLFDGVGALDLEPMTARATPLVTHLVYRVTG